MILVQDGDKIFFTPEIEYDMYYIERISKKFKTFNMEVMFENGIKKPDIITIDAHEFINVIADIVPDAK